MVIVVLVKMMLLYVGPYHHHQDPDLGLRSGRAVWVWETLLLLLLLRGPFRVLGDGALGLLVLAGSLGGLEEYLLRVGWLLKGEEALLVLGF